MSDYYDHTGFPSTRSAGLSTSMRAELVKIETGFAKLPVLTGNGDKVVVVSSSGTSLSVTTGTITLSGNFIKAASHSLTLTTTATTNVTFPTTGTLATLAGSETFTNKTITAPVLSGSVTGTYTLAGTPTISSPVLSGTTSGTVTLGGAVTLNTTVTAGHYIGGSSALPAMNWSLVKTGAGSSFVYALATTCSLTGGVSDSIIGYSFGTSVTKAGSGTHTYIDGVFISPPSISGSATGTNGSTLRISGAPASGATNLYALNIEAGTSKLGGLLDISGASAGQIKFPGTQNASSDVNTLDDYEEGTWTPSLGGSTTYTFRAGTYTKIGRIVHLQGNMTVNLLGTGSTTQITGLPFTASSAGVDFTGATSVSNAATSLVSIMCQIASAGTVVMFPAFTASGTGTTMPAIFQNGASVSFALTYMV